MTRVIFANNGENAIHEKFVLKKNFSSVPFFRYPEPTSQLLRNKIAIYVGCAPSQVLCTNGSDEAFVLLLRLFTHPQEEVIICPPTFFMYEYYANITRSKIRKVKRLYDFSINTNSIIKHISRNTKIIILDSPGNPTGIVIPLTDIKKLLQTGIIVIVDEAYFEYCGITAFPLLKLFPNLVITRTFSKWAGMAGLRVGYVLASEKIIADLGKLKLPFNVNSIGLQVALSVLDQKTEYYKRIKKVIRLRDQIIVRLRQIDGVYAYPSQSAFILIQFRPEIAIQKLISALTKVQIFVKYIEQPMLKHCIRVNFSYPSEAAYFVGCLERIIENQKKLH